MQRDTMIQWLSDLAEEARQYAQVYHTWLEAGREESFRSVLELILLMDSALNESAAVQPAAS